MSLEKVLQETRDMPRHQVAELIEQLTLQLSPDADVEESWRQETKTRMAQIANGTVQGISEEAVAARINHITQS